MNDVIGYVAESHVKSRIQAIEQYLSPCDIDEKHDICRTHYRRPGPLTPGSCGHPDPAVIPQLKVELRHCKMQAWIEDTLAENAARRASTP